jgi:hypothetical protein
MTDLHKEIYRSFELLDLEDDWDNNGDGAIKLSTTVFNKAMFLLFQIIGECGENIVVPEINLCPNNSIDFSFRDYTGDIGLLINVRETGYGYYGKNKFTNEEIERSLSFHYTQFELNQFIKNNLCN